MQFKKLIAFALPIILAITTSGCVDVYILKDFFEKKPPEYVWREKILNEEEPITWSDNPIPIPIPIPIFNQTITVLIGSNYTLLNYTFEVKKDTKELKVEIENITEEFYIEVAGNKTQIPYTDRIKAIIRATGYEPHINISIIDSDGKIADSEEYKDDANATFLNITKNIGNGNWKVSIETRAITMEGTVDMGFPVSVKGVWELTYTEPIVSAYEIK